MQAEGNAREQRIRSRVLKEKAAASALDRQITDAHLKQMLKHASFLADDVEKVLVPHALKAANPRDFAMWLSTAELTCGPRDSTGESCSASTCTGRAPSQ